jgi:hypothetical protein
VTARLADPYRDTDVIDSRAPRFNQAVVANMVGAMVLGLASASYAAGWTSAGAGLGLLVSALALLAAATGFCTGREADELGRGLTGRPFVSCPIPAQPR